MPVANEANQVFSSLEAQFKGIVEAVTDESAPVLPNAMLATTPAPYRAGKFSLDKVKLGHQSNRFSISSEVAGASNRSAEHTSELQSLMRISYAVFCLKKKKKQY